MDSFGMRVVNPGRLYDDFDRLSRSQGQRTLRKAAYAGARVIWVTVRARAPVDKGVLKSSIRLFRVRSDRLSGVSYAVGIGKAGKRYVNNRRNRRAGKVGQETNQLGPGFYGAFIELGTSRMKAQPWMRPGNDEAEPDAIDAVMKELAASIDRELFG